ncbi:MAG TPA: carboxypeptidase-like regulatory domain-containing protein [Blastocatellia bacterium]|nr:carboxypeptidase-like regulatory domain-containing protein [Blastocatellia bacterium]
MPALAVAILMLMMTGFAQEFRATLTGRVTDAGGAAVPSAKITVKNLQTGEEFSATSGGDGNYTLPFLIPGTA